MHKFLILCAVFVLAGCANQGSTTPASKDEPHHAAMGGHTSSYAADAGGGAQITSGRVMSAGGTHR